jgi:HKD family nuclease
MLVRGVVAQGAPNGANLASVLGEVLQNKDFDRLDVAVAYATQQGISALKEVLGEWPAEMRWVVGLDDAITQPAAIDTLLGLNGVGLQLARLGPQRRFHPKLYCFWSSEDPATCLIAIGSANMTKHGLTLNGEATIFLEAETEAEADQLKEAWAALNALGEPVGTFDLDEYRALHARARKARTRLADKGFLPQQPEADEPTLAFNGDPATATVAFADFGSAMGNGREIEFPKPMMPYFGIEDGTGSPQPQTLHFDGNVQLDIPLVRRPDNGMWRMTFGAQVPGSDVLKRQVVNGVKQRSNQAVVFERNEDGSFNVHFVQLGSGAYNDLMTSAQQLGTVDRTIPGPKGKNYGFF